MRLSELAEVLARLGVRPKGGHGGDPEITGLALDSREVRDGDVFVAIDGTAEDGASYVPEAVKRGAVAVVCENDLAALQVPRLVVGNARMAAAEAAAAFYGHPSRELYCCGITGTNGKTTTAALLHSILVADGRETGVVGTIGISMPGFDLPSDRTTPDAITLQGRLRQMVDRGATDCVMEVSSHALCQARVHGVQFETAVFTNLSPEHLDYHGDMGAYADAKAQLFAGLDEGATAVLNAEDPASARMRAVSVARALTYALDAPADISARISEKTAEGTRFTIRLTRSRALDVDGEIPVSLAMIGRHNVANALAATGAALAMGISPEAVGRGLGAAQPVRGRLEQVAADAPFGIYVDYAHTDDALAAVLGALRPLTSGRLICVFGCGGDRDRAKRPRMGRVAGDGADRAVLTSDNPRSEDPDAIIAEVAAGVESGRDRLVVEPDRRTAIRLALEMADPGDVVLIAGKGHETGQIIGDEQLPFDDARVALETWKEINSAGLRV